MLWIALIVPLVGALLTYWRGATSPGSPPLWLKGWLLTITDEPRWSLQRGWLVVLIGIWPAFVVASVLQGVVPPAMLVMVAKAVGLQASAVPIAAAVATWAGSALAFTLGHGQFQDYGTWAPPPDYVPEDSYLHDFIGMAWTGGAVALIGALMLATWGLWVPAGLFMVGGVMKAVAYSIGWTGIGRRILGPYWEPTRFAEVLQGAFLYAGVSAALLIGVR